MNTARVDPPPPADSALLHARRIAALSLADAFGEPPCPTPAPLMLETIAAAWDALRDAHAEIVGDRLSLSERPPTEIDPDAVSVWLTLPAHLRTAALRRVLGHVVSRDCPPCETEYLPSHDAATRAQHMADLGGFYRAFGVWPDGSHPRRPDHVQFIVGFVGVLLMRRCEADTEQRAPSAREHAEVCDDALFQFLHDHAAWWLPTFARRVEERARDASRYGEAVEDTALAALAGVARSLRCWTAVERSAMGIDPVRRIVQPMIGGADSDEPDCNECGTCSVPSD